MRMWDNLFLSWACYPSSNPSLSAAPQTLAE